MVYVPPKDPVLEGKAVVLGRLWNAWKVEEVRGSLEVCSWKIDLGTY